VNALIRSAIEMGVPAWTDVPESEWPDKLDVYFVFFSGGWVRLSGLKPIVHEDLMVVKRFGETFGFAYSRFKELRDKEAQNRRLVVEASVARIRAEVQEMDRAEDFRRVLALVTDDLKTVGLHFDACEIDLLNEPVDVPSMAHFEDQGFRYTTYTLAPDGHVAAEIYAIAAPFPTVIRQTLERFIEREPWFGRSDELSLVEVAAGGYGRLRLTASDREAFTDEEAYTLQEFADAIALGYARYLDIRTIQEQTERKSAFLASMSHELRTPMNAITGFTRMVLRREGDRLSERQQGNLGKVTQSADHLLDLINDILDLSKIEAGRMDVDARPFDVKDLISGCCAEVEPLVKPGVKLGYDIADEIGEANTDQARVRQIVVNLLGNAVKFTEQGEVKVEARRQEGGEQLVITVSDTGTGIPADALETVLRNFSR